MKIKIKMLSVIHAISEFRNVHNIVLKMFGVKIRSD